jgi:uncharacterized membrane protein YkoI
MKKLLILALAAAIAAPLAASAAPLKGSQYSAQAKIGLAQARTIALSKEHGTIVDQELEKEAGGLRYSFDVKVGKVIHEVGVNAITGKVIEDSIDTGAD